MTSVVRRRVFISTLAGGLLAAPLAVEAQQPGKVYRIGILGEKASDASEARLWEAFRVGLRERGWIEGKNIVIESRWAEGNSARIPELAADLVRLKVDVIVMRGSIYVQAAKAATSSIPIVFTTHADPVETGHVASLARPAGNITGLAILMTDLNVKGLEMLISVVPKAKRIAVLGNPNAPSHAPSLKALEEASARTRVTLGSSWRRPGSCSPASGCGPVICTRQRTKRLRGLKVAFQSPQQSRRPQTPPLAEVLKVGL